VNEMLERTMAMVIPVAAAVLFMVSCACAPDVTGKWREMGNPGTIEFFKDGTFKTVDNQGMAAGGKYSLDKQGNMVFEITRKDSAPEVVHSMAVVKKRELTLVFSRNNEILTYVKED